MYSYITEYSSPLGKMLLASDGNNLTGAWFERQKYFPDISSGIFCKQLPLFSNAFSWLELYFSGKNPSAFTPLKPQGTPFQEMIWYMLQQIPYGKTTTYGNLARQVALQTGKPYMAAQAIGNAVGHNPISIFIPCHRVVGVMHKLTGYAGGIDRKEALLKLEGAIY